MNEKTDEARKKSPQEQAATLTELQQQARQEANTWPLSDEDIRNLVDGTD